MLIPGKCRWCGCTYKEPCPGSCGWANREHTLCTACVDVDREWGQQKSARPPNMRYAFFRGFMVGVDDERAIDFAKPNKQDRATHQFRPLNPYGPGATRRFWQRGFDAGARLAR
jgi:hypothetical protein